MPSPSQTQEPCPPATTSGSAPPGPTRSGRRAPGRARRCAGPFRGLPGGAARSRGRRSRDACSSCGQTRRRLCPAQRGHLGCRDHVARGHKSSSGQARAFRQQGRGEVAVRARQTLEHRVERELGKATGLELGPGPRRRDRRQLPAPQRVGRDRRLRGWFCDQSKSTLPGRSAFVIRLTTSFGFARSSSSAIVAGVAVHGHGVLAARDRRVELHALAAAASPARTPARPRQPLPGGEGRPRCIRRGRRAGPGRGRRPAGRGRGRRRAARPPLRRVDLERGEVGGPDQAREAVDQREVDRLAVLSSSPGPAAATVRTQSGVPIGAFFSKNFSPSTPSGQRIRVTGRSASLRQQRRRDRGVVRP